MSKKISQARLTIEELHQLKWVIGSLLTLLSLWALSELELTGRNLVQLSSVAVFVALIKPEWIHLIPAIIWPRFVAPSILLITFIGLGLEGFVNFFNPLMHLIVLLLIYRTLAPRTQREDLQMLLLCLLSIVVSGTITVSLLFALQILLFTPLAMAFLLMICLLDREPEIANHSPDWQKFNFIRLICRVWNAVDVRMCALGMLLFAFMVVFSTAFFVLIPRFNLGQAVSFLQMETKSVSGFSETVRLDSVSEIVEDHSIVLRVDVPGIEAIRSTPYWRVLVLDAYSDGVFQLSDEASKLRRHTQLRELSEWNAGSVPAKLLEDSVWTLYFEGGVSKYLPLPGMFNRMRFPKSQKLELLLDLNIIGLNAVQSNIISYQIEDIFWNVRTPASDVENRVFHEYSTCGKLENNNAPYPLKTLELKLKPEERDYLSEINDTLTQGRSTDIPATEYSSKVATYLRNNFRYSLKPSDINDVGDPIVNWIKAGKSGHCELFAGAFVLLARNAGYPARMAVGFAGGSWNAIENFFVVRNSNAHAWAEIYDSKAKEWLRVDPTPGESAVDPEVLFPASFEFETGVGAWADSLRMQWYRRIVSFDYNDQTKIVTSTVNLWNTFIKKLSSWAQEVSALLLNCISNPFNRESIVSGIIAATLCSGIVYLWHIRLRWLHFFHRLTKEPQAMNPIRRQSSQYLKRLITQISEPDISESHLKALQLVRAELEALRFGPGTSTRIANPIFRKARKILHNKNNIKL